nr:uncharacterized protein LOC129278122 [Lytechinus pictus]
MKVECGIAKLPIDFGVGGDIIAMKANQDMRNRLRDRQAQYDDLLNSSLQPEDVAQRINHVGNMMVTEQVEEESLVGPQGEGDVVGQSLAGLQVQLMGRMRQAQQEAERAKRYQQKAEWEAKSLRHHLEQMQARLRDMAMRDQDQNKVKGTDWDEEEMMRMRDEVGRLRRQLQHAKNQQVIWKIVTFTHETEAF